MPTRRPGPHLHQRSDSRTFAGIAASPASRHSRKRPVACTGVAGAGCGWAASPSARGADPCTRTRRRAPRTSDWPPASVGSAWPSAPRNSPPRGRWRGSSAFLTTLAWSTSLRAFGAREIASGLGLLAQPDRAAWAWSRVGGDAVDLAFLGSAANEDSANHQRVALAAAAVAGRHRPRSRSARAACRRSASSGAPPAGTSRTRSASSGRSPSRGPSRRCSPSGRATRTCRDSCVT